MVLVDTPEGQLHLVHWHLGLAERERHWQVNHLLAHPLFLESAELPTLIVGDTNDWRNTLCRGPFAAARLPPRHAADLAVPFVSGLFSDGLARQNILPWYGPGPGGPHGANPPGQAGQRPFALGRRFPSNTRLHRGPGARPKRIETREAS